MKPSDLVDYCLKKTGAHLDFPFGEIPAVFKVCGKIFAELYPKSEDFKITLKCDPFLAEAYRSMYPDIVIPGYHVPNKQKKYRNTVYLEKGIEEGEIFKMIDHSYAEVVKKLKKSERELLNNYNAQL